MTAAGEAPAQGGPAAFEPRGAVLATVLSSLVPVILALVVGAIILLALGRDPLEFYWIIIKRALLSSFGLQDVVIRMTPLLLLGAGLIVAFRAGLWNLGVDGQFLMSAVIIAACGPTFVAVMPWPLAIGLLLVIGIVLGALWAIGPALLRAYYGVSEIITTLMMTFLGARLSALLVKTVFNDPGTTVPQTVVLDVAERLPRLFGSQVHMGIIIAVLAVLLVHFVMTRTAFGLKLQVVGANPAAAIHAGFNMPLLTIAVFGISAGLAGLGGAVEILGVRGVVRAEWNPAFGFFVVPLVFLARFNGPAVILFVAFFAVLQIGGETAARKAHLSNHFILVLVALILVFLAVTEHLVGRWQKRRGL